MELVYFTAPWCAPCRTLGPVMEKVTEVPVKKVDVDKDTPIATAYSVYSVPTVIAVTSDGKELGRFSGSRDFEFVKRFIASHAS